MEENTLYMTLTGRLDTVTTPAWHAETEERLRETGATALCIDCGALDYISSTGLRALMNLRRRGCSIRLAGVSQVVWDVLESTGFTEMMEVERAFRHVKVAEDDLIARGTVGLIYRLDEDRVVKVFSRQVNLEQIRREREYARKALLAGIPTVISYDVVVVEDCYGIIFEMASSSSFSGLLNAEPERFDELADRYAALLGQLHRTRMTPGEFPPVKAMYHRYVDTADYLDPDEQEALNGLIDSVPDRDTVLHGDFHANNIMNQGDELVFIDLGDIALGHPVFDLAGMYVSHILAGTYRPEFIRAGMGIGVDVCRRLWNHVLRAYFPGETEEGLRQKEDLIRRFAHLKLAVMYAIAPGLEQYLGWEPLADARAVLFRDLEGLKAELREDSLC